MKKLHFIYKMQLEFDAPISQHRFTFKCCPRTSERQQIRDLTMDIFPKEFYSTGCDSFGNSYVYGCMEREHDEFVFQVEGTAITGLTHLEKAEDRYRIGKYLYPTEFTKPGPTLQKFADQFDFLDGMSNYLKAVMMMERLFKEFQYVSGATGTQTTAEEALALGKGVCQDYSHIMIALCRMKGIPARYVVGMLMGEGVSHAWVEVLSDGIWIGLDPTNNLFVEDQHIKISHGRDYGDCRINRGIFMGCGQQIQTISVTVEEYPRRQDERNITW